MELGVTAVCEASGLLNGDINCFLVENNPIGIRIPSRGGDEKQAHPLLKSLMKLLICKKCPTH